MQMKVGAVGIPWYRPEEYQELRALFADGARLHESFADWERTAIQVEKETQGTGLAVVRVELHPREFAAWCRDRKRDVDASARSEYASLAAKEWWDRERAKSPASDA